MKRTFFSLLLLFFVFVSGVVLGSEILNFKDLWGSPVAELRFFRMLGALFIGGALSLSGMVFQAVLRNPLAEPYTLGVSAGSGVGAAAAFITGLHAVSVYSVPLAALAGALVTVLFVLRISRAGGSEKLLLSGVIAGTICSSVLMFLLSVARSEEIAAASWWLLGDLQGIEPLTLLPALLLLGICYFILRINAMGLNMLSLGDSSAWNGGFDPRKLTLLAVICASLLAGMTIAMAGVISFCGLIVPHMVRKIRGCDYRKILLPLLISGGAFLMFCDLLSRLIHPEREIPIGVITSLIGGPLFLWIINRRHSHDS